MGTHLFIPQESSSKSNKMCKFLKSKLSSNCKSKTGTKSIDDFIIKHLQHNNDNDSKIDINSFDQRRIVFISLIGLYKTWKNVPSVLLYSSLFCMPLHQKWIYNPIKYIKQIRAHFVSELSIFTDVAEIDQFIHLLKWKDSQGLVMWMFDDPKVIQSAMQSTKKSMESSKIKPVHSFWHNLSNKLEQLYDPFTQRKYKPLNFDLKYIKDKEYRISILNELYGLTMQYNTMKAIISESNPISLRPLTSYLNNIDGDKVTNISMKKITNQQLLNLYDDVNININISISQHTEETDVWFIAEDY